MKKVITQKQIVLLIVLILCASIVYLFSFKDTLFGSVNNPAAQLIATISIATNSSSIASSTISLSFVGDIMLDRSVKSSIKKNGAGDYNWIFANADFLKRPDVMFANLEGPVSLRGANVGSIYSFRFDPAVVPAIKNAGIDVVSMANNHIGDWSRAALEDTIKYDAAGGLLQTGGGMNKLEAVEPKIIEVNGIKVGYVAFSDFGPKWVIATASSSGILSATDPNIKTIISNAAKKVDVLIVSYHFGVEYKTRSNSRQQYLARLAIDSGAKIVAGSHPHVGEEIEKYHGGIIAYSLGNFIFDQYFSKETMQGLMLNVTVDKLGVVSYSTNQILLNAKYQPSLGVEVERGNLK